MKIPVQTEEFVDWMNAIPRPRPFRWQWFIFWRRVLYGIGSLFLLLALVGFPMAEGMQQVRSYNNFDAFRPIQIALFFGALVVVAFVRISYLIYKQYDDSKWLARYGEVTEANLLWTLSGSNTVVICYRFWDLKGKEHQRETTLNPDGPTPVPALAAGDMAPVLYDPSSPEQRNVLWAEAARYVQIHTHAHRHKPVAEQV